MNSPRKGYSILASCSALLLAGQLAEAFGPYYVNCDGQHVSTKFGSVFGEIRSTSTAPTVPLRYHAGADISDSNCVLDADVFAIEAGKIENLASPACSSSICRRVTSSAGTHAFDYVDIQSSLAAGATVQVGDFIGQIKNFAEGPHLHLNEIQAVGQTRCASGGFDCFRINPQRRNGLIFTESDVPNFPTFTLGAVLDQSIIPVQYLSAGPKGGQTPAPFNFVDDTFYVNGNVDVLVLANGSTTSGVRKGVYLVDMAPIAAGQPCTGLNITANPNIYFNTLFDQRTLLRLERAAVHTDRARVGRARIRALPSAAGRQGPARLRRRLAPDDSQLPARGARGGRLRARARDAVDLGALPPSRGVRGRSRSLSNFGPFFPARSGRDILKDQIGVVTLRYKHNMARTPESQINLGE